MPFQLTPGNGRCDHTRSPMAYRCIIAGTEQLKHLHVFKALWQVVIEIRCYGEHGISSLSVDKLEQETSGPADRLN